MLCSLPFLVYSSRQNVVQKGDFIMLVDLIWQMTSPSELADDTNLVLRDEGSQVRRGRDYWEL